ncbi:MAG: radical SAM protein [Elusimicrobia bacterium]|nr:radical SAM protein [Elusimicrobiota bacterium]
MKLALIQPPVWGITDPPLGLAQLAGCCRAAGCETSVFDLNILLWKERLQKYESLWLWEQFQFWNQPGFVAAFFKENEASVGRHIEAILKTDATVIGISVASGSHLAALELARRLKAADPKRKLILGGPYFYFGDKIAETIAEPCVDMVVRGAADVLLPEVLKRFDRTGELGPAPGAWVKREGTPVSGGEPEPVRDLDSVPFADFSGFPMELYGDPERIPIAASRGCVWQCRFCSAHAFWPGYARMGGDRIFAEVMHHKRTFPERCHVEFYDITANGDVKALHRFSQLVIKAVAEDRQKNFIGWKINAVLRPEMTPEVLKDLRAANCHDIIYGVESGSARVLKAMNKNYSPETAERVLKDTHDAGIVTVGNFMFGFPGETEEDFQMTLDFLRRNRPSLDRVYASATFTSLEAHSYLLEHQAELGVRELPPGQVHNLYWESQDGSNTYPVRLERYKRFRSLAIALGLDAYKGVQGALEQDHLSNLAQYHHFKGQPLSALEDYSGYLELDLYHEPTLEHLRRYLPHLENLRLAARALAKADRAAAGRTHAAPAQAWEAVQRRMDAGQTWDEFLAGAPQPLERFLFRAAVFLHAMSGESTRVEWGSGRFELFWARERVSDLKALQILAERLRAAVRLAKAETERGESAAPAPVCAR